MMRGQLRIALLVTAFTVGCGDGGAFETSHGAVDDGNRALAAGKGATAAEAYAAAAAELPESAALNYNRGLADSLAGKHDEATQLLFRALGSRQAALLQKVEAGLGVAYSRWALALETAAPAAPPEGEEGEEAPNEALAKWERAVDHLTQALVYDPTDAAVRRNLEIALLRVDPPCASRNDEFEPNDSPAAAKPVEVAAPEPTQSGGEAPQGAAAKDRLTWKQQLTLCPEDVDWFKIALNPGDRLTAKLVTPEDAGEIALTLVGPDGARELATPQKALGEAEPVLAYMPEVGGSYYLRVTNVDYDEVSYSLDVELRPPCLTLDDHLEDNDAVASAAVLTPGALSDLKICPEDDDWYSVQLAEGESLFLFASVTASGEEDEAADKPKDGEPPPPPPLHTKVFAQPAAPVIGGEGEGDEAVAVPAPEPTLATLVEVAKGAPTGQGRVTTLLTPGAGRYFIRVWGDPELESRYQMTVQVVPPCPDGDDGHEDNDIVEDAVDIMEAAQGGAAAADPQGGGAPPGAAQGQQGPPSFLARICPGDSDWFHYTVTGDKPAIVSATFEHDKGDLRLTAFDPAAEKIGESDVSEAEINAESVVLPPPGEDEDAEAGKRYTLHVEGVDGAENFYILRVDQPSGGGDGEQGDPNDEPQDPDDSKDDKSDEPPKDDPQDPQPQPDTPLEEALDNLDRNPENLEAMEHTRRNPMAGHRPRKDW